MRIRLSTLGEELGAELHGSGGREITGVCSLDARGETAEHCLAFVAKGHDPAEALRSQVAQILVAARPEGALGGRSLLVVADPTLAFARVGARFHPLPRAEADERDATALVDPSAELESPVRVDARVVVGPRARVGRGSVLMAGAVVGAGATLGPDCIVYPGAVLYEGVELGARVRVHAGAVLGADGFGYAWSGSAYERVPQVGTVVLEDDVEVGACACIDRATFGATRVGRGTKIDNLVHVAHNCRIGEHAALAAQVGIAGSTRVGARARLAGQVGIIGHLEIADGVALGGQCGVIQDIDEPGAYFGTPALPVRQALRSSVVYARLGEVERELRALRARVCELEGGGAPAS